MKDKKGYREGRMPTFWEKFALSLSVSLFHFFNKRDLVIDSVKHEGLLLEFAPKKYRDDLEIVSLAVENNYLSFQYASNKLRVNKKIVIKMLKINALVLEVMPPYLLNDGDIWVTVATSPNGFSVLQYMPEKFKNNKEYMLSLLKKNGKVLEFCESSIQNDPVMVFAAVKKCPLALKYASDEIKNNLDFLVKLESQHCFFSEVGGEKIQELIKKHPGKSLKEIAKIQ